MIVGIGLDIVELARIERFYRDKPSFATRILTPAEQKEFARLSGRRAIEYLAGRFAAKEAYAKAIGTGLGAACGFQDIEVLKSPSGAPVLRANKEERRVHISVTHSEQVACVQVIIEE
ncbi:holo-ACP synthase [Bacillaceae bacterium SIJ1]|uniref:holo-ACP synthase n=1 Tax=Litoribacterium kuwaitense TaxID=1398745 RepID=UPI0013EB3E88|nr:holo-ACP synthase [Litoribacterium kuwaitense]NGP46254.1 holo-ACP synthase [Litoribacterium kuwaitense]